MRPGTGMGPVFREPIRHTFPDCWASTTCGASVRPAVRMTASPITRMGHLGWERLPGSLAERHEGHQPGSAIRRWVAGLVSPPRWLLAEPPGGAVALQPTDAQDPEPPGWLAQRRLRAAWRADVPLQSLVRGVRALPVHEPAEPPLVRSHAVTYCHHGAVGGRRPC